MTFYQEIAKLKNVLRKGWVVRDIKGENGRVESDAEHTFSMVLLSLEMINKFKLKLDQEKVMKMVLYHELCEIDYGDHTPMDKITKEEKYLGELKCIQRLSRQYNMPEILTLWQEFEEGKTPEAQFVKEMDKLDAIMQSKIYADSENRQDVFEVFKNYSLDIFNKYIDNENSVPDNDRDL